MINGTNEITQKGFDKLVEERDNLKNVVRQEISMKIKEAKDFGDLSENAEFDEARKEQAQVEARIKQLDKIIEQAIIIDTSSISSKAVSLGVSVTLYDLDFEEECVYEIVGENEADPINGFLSASSPVGSALIGKKKGDEVNVEVPDGIARYKILKISKDTSNKH